MEAKQDRPASFRSSRPVTPTTPHKSNVRASSAPGSAHKQAWVVADWKHRVPEPGLPGPKPAAGSLNSRQRAHAVQERKKHLANEYAHLHETINNILNRCNQVQQRLGSKSNSSSNTGSSKPCSPTYVSKRSKILFEAPNTPIKTAAGVAAGSSVNTPSYAGVDFAADSAAAATLQCRQQPRPNTWSGAVDLNPGFSFKPGSPQRIAATCPDELPMLLSKAATFIDDLQDSNLLRSSRANSNNGSNNSSSAGVSNLKHREVLQAGLQQLNGEFYGAMRAAAVQKKQQGVIPASWASS